MGQHCSLEMPLLDMRVGLLSEWAFRICEKGTLKRSRRRCGRRMSRGCTFSIINSSTVATLTKLHADKTVSKAQTRNLGLLKEDGYETHATSMIHERRSTSTGQTSPAKSSMKKFCTNVCRCRCHGRKKAGLLSALQRDPDAVHRCTRTK